MIPSPVLLVRNALRVLIPVSIALTAYLYLYPVFQTCGFPLTPEPHGLESAPVTGSPSQPNGLSAFLETVRMHWQLPFAAASEPDDTDQRPAGTPRDLRRIAPFRLLALGDPQLEGDTSIPKAGFPHLASCASRLAFRTKHKSLRDRVRQSLHDLVDFYFEDIPTSLESVRKRIDLFGNDFYLAHIYRTLSWWSVPTHVTVLGDLLGSQWVNTKEFERRGARYWNRVFRGGERVPDDVALPPAEEYDIAGYLGQSLQNETWAKRVINVAGNHDIGYAGDINNERLSRFERVFGKANYELRFEIPVSSFSPEVQETIFDEDAHPESDRLIPELRIIVLNDMNLDTPAASGEIQDQTYKFVNDIINTASAVEFKGHFTVVLTHVPLYKSEGICVDSPFFAFHDSDGTLKEQNQLSAAASRGFLEGIFGLNGDTMAPANGRGRRGVILNGHDHEGCDTYHYINQTHGQSVADREWQVARWENAVDGIVDRPGLPGLREITLRSMMGDFGGNAGLLSAWFDEDSWEWRFDFATCPLGRQHLWWAVHIFDLIVFAIIVVYGILKGLVATGLIVEERPRKISTNSSRKEAAEPAGKGTNGAAKEAIKA